MRRVSGRLPVTEAIINAGQEIGDPVGTEFRGIEAGMRLGRDLDSLLRDIAKRDRENRRQLQPLEDTHRLFHSGASTLTSWYCHPVYRGLVKRTFRQP